MINELTRSPTRSENVYFANNEQASIAVFTAVFCFTRAEHNLIKLELLPPLRASEIVECVRKVCWWNLTKSEKSGPLWTMSSHSVFVLTDYG